MRISYTMLTSATARSLDSLKQRLAKVQGQIAGGEVVANAADDPYRAVAAMELTALQRRVERAEAAATEAGDWLSAAENGLSRMLNAVQQSRQLSVSARSTLPADARTAIAQEIERMRDETLSAGNTRYRGVYLFAGNRVDTAPFAADGSGGLTYAGDNGDAQVEVAPGTRVGIRVPGSRLQAGGDIGRILTDLAAAVRSGNDVGIAQVQDQLDLALTTVINERSDVGVRMRTLEDYAQAARDTQVQISAQLSQATGTDLARAALELAQEEVAYRAALGAAARALPPSLMEAL